MTTQSRPVLVVGGAGFIGSNLSHRLLELGHRVRIFDNLSRPSVERNLRWLRAEGGRRLEVEIADVRDPISLQRAVRGVSHVFHFAAQVAVTSSLEDPLHDFEVNAQGTLNLLEAIRSLPEPPSVLFTSTNKVYGGLEDLRLTGAKTRYEATDPRLRESGIGEDRPLDFESPYGCSKGAAEQYVLDYARSFGLRTVVFRMSCIYGPRQFGTEDQGWVAHFLMRALREQPLTIYGDGRQVRDILFIEDLVRALLAAQRSVDQLAGQAFNIGGGPAQTVSLLELLELLESICRQRPAIRFANWRPGDQRYYVSNTARFQAATGWAPRIGVQSGLVRLRHWIEEVIGEEVPQPRLPLAPDVGVQAV